MQALHWVDALIFIIYMIAVLGVGFYFHRKNRDQKDYYVGGKGLGSTHVGLSVVATDVGGGFSIGLGGLGFAMGIAGSWMLFTGLVGAWLSAVLLIPRVYNKGRSKGLFTFPQLLGATYGSKVALAAGIISFIGYLGFTASQLLAGAKLASGTFPALDLSHAIVIMGVIAVAYTAFGGIKAVIYTDTFQWLLLMGGLLGIGLPMAYAQAGGWQAVVQTLPDQFFDLGNLKWSQAVNWAVTIIPIWFIGMTLYQRIFTCRSEKAAKKAWFIAGLFEYPLMAFMGVGLGLLARVCAEQGLFAPMGFTGAAGIDAELGMPMLLRSILPVGLMGLMLSAYFSAIMSTADSCLLAASGNWVTDIVNFGKQRNGSIRSTQWATLIIGLLAILIASVMESVLELMLLSYSFMVAGLLVPTLYMLFHRKPHPIAALFAIFVGGISTLLFQFSGIQIPFELDPIIPGLLLSWLGFSIATLFIKKMSWPTSN